MSCPLPESFKGNQPLVPERPPLVVAFGLDIPKADHIARIRIQAPAVDVPACHCRDCRPEAGGDCTVLLQEGYPDNPPRKFRLQCPDGCREKPRDEGIPAPDRIICQVAEAICSFRLLCEKYKVPSFWTDFIEESLHELAPESYKEKLSGWQNGKVPSYHESAHHIENARLELSERGNLHLYATIDGKEMKYIISKDSETVHDILSGEISENRLQTIKKLVSKFLLPKIASRCDRL